MSHLIMLLIYLLMIWYQGIYIWLEPDDVYILPTSLGPALSTRDDVARSMVKEACKNNKI